MFARYDSTPVVHIFILFDKLTKGWIYYIRYYISKFTGDIVERNYEFFGGKIHFVSQKKIINPFPHIDIDAVRIPVLR